MSDKTITALPAASATADTDLLPAVQGGVTVKLLLSAIKAFVLTGVSSAPVNGVARPELQTGITGLGTVASPFTHADNAGGIVTAIASAYGPATALASRGSCIQLADAEYKMTARFDFVRHGAVIRGLGKAYAQDRNAEDRPTGGSIIAMDSAGQNSGVGIGFSPNTQGLSAGPGMTRVEMDRFSVWGAGYNPLGATIAQSGTNGFNFGLGFFNRHDSILISEMSIHNCKYAYFCSSGNFQADVTRIVGLNITHCLFGIMLIGLGGTNGGGIWDVSACVVADNDGPGFWNGSTDPINNSTSGVGATALGFSRIHHCDFVRCARKSGNCALRLNLIGSFFTDCWVGSPGRDTNWPGLSVTPNALRATAVDGIVLEGTDNIFERILFQDVMTPGAYCIRLRAGASRNEFRANKFLDSNTGGGTGGYIIIETGCDSNVIRCSGNTPPIKINSGATNTVIIWDGTLSPPTISDAGTGTIRRNEATGTAF